MPGIKCVPDTNVVIAFHRSANPESPNREFYRRWRMGQFVVAYSRDTVQEYARKLRERGVSTEAVARFLQVLVKLGEVVQITHFHFRKYPVDMDDVAFLLCAANGNATHLISYDAHLLELSGFHPFQICRTVEFLQQVRTTVGGYDPGLG